MEMSSVQTHNVVTKNGHWNDKDDGEDEGGKMEHHGLVTTTDCITIDWCKGTYYGPC